MEIEPTNDGSPTLFVPELNEHYHSTKGAVTESQHIFIHMGLEQTTAIKPRVLEIGFGTGLNAFLTLLAAEKLKRDIHYTSIELYPLKEELVRQLGYPEQIAPDRADDFYALHRAEWNKEVTLNLHAATQPKNNRPDSQVENATLQSVNPTSSLVQGCEQLNNRPQRNCRETAVSEAGTSDAPRFTLYKIEGDFTRYALNGTYDVVYFDAFAPEKQPEMWEQALFDKLFDLLNPAGILTTYCSKGVVRRMLQASGFKVERLPGPPNGKREILRATKVQAGIQKE